MSGIVINVKRAEVAGGVLGLVASVVAAFTHRGVKDGAGRVAAMSKVAKGVNVEIKTVAVVFNIIDITPDLGGGISCTLGEVNNTVDVGLLLWVLKDALGINSVVESLVGVSSDLHKVAVVGPKWLVFSRPIENAKKIWLNEAISGLEIMMIIITVVVTSFGGLDSDGHSKSCSVFGHYFYELFVL